MSGQKTAPPTGAEIAALQALGLAWVDHVRLLTRIEVEPALLAAYRAGFRDGSKPPETRVFRAGDPEPGPEVIAVEDEDGEIWNRYNGGWGLGATQTASWQLALTYGPLVAGLPAPNAAYDVAVAADAERRAAEQAAGGAR